MVEIVFEQASFFKKIIDSLKGLVEDISFKCTSDGMDLQAMDISHVSLISISLPADIFNTYNCSEEMNLAFNVDVLNKVLKSASTDDYLKISTEKPNEDITIQLSTQSEDKNTRFNLKPVDINGDAVSIPEHIYKAKLSLSSNAFNQLIRSLSEVNDSVAVRCTEGSISFSVSDILLNATTTFNAGVTNEKAEEEIEVDVTEGCKVAYALRYLKAISAASALSTRVNLSFSPHFPLLVEYSLQEGGYVRFYLAPKVDEEASEDEV
ncbi:proliferating cell nuclear antigen, putative [Trichomonas vaginalis G3]|uniref:DNA sliding clamp PCNA n=1 Tax=Trichomonas vaginalis (strain ATCC PRA-98 / G3) TaxID=412133 RepID=A2F7D4_TRIV3|nr:DNA polymerase processivity factor protein [Trichomonas vaginalis G3]EAX99202.1 proliferating cell nuclear antigen, putative [Trichomonas vaginalis G3]KAI5487959.1 DNA polymerase processivity factor protein [Trichomonas vaginalis G3]|eukprot:XP_001312132.1 proliferating cell nuclear antigen [Trichomonas vaginalis G3]